MSDQPINDELDLVAQLEAQQPTRTGKTRPSRRFDKTQLHSTHHGRYVHRDYAAHAFRWGWVSRHLKRGDRVLDVGCGQELPLMHVLSGNMSILPSYYLGVDLNKVPFSGSPKWADVRAEFNFIDDYAKLEVRDLPDVPETDLGDKRFNVVTNFEVIEHMQPVDGKKMLEGFKHWLKSTGRLYLSTPVFDGKAAVNHCHEYTIPELQTLLEGCGFAVEKRFGTFASKRDIRPVMTAEHRKAYDDLEDFYGGDVMATFMAPLYPDASRNNMWVCSPLY